MTDPGGAMKLLGRFLCRLGFHDMVWTTSPSGLARWQVHRPSDWQRGACLRDGCDWLVMRKGGG